MAKPQSNGSPELRHQFIALVPSDARAMQSIEPPAQPVKPQTISIEFQSELSWAPEPFFETAWQAVSEMHSISFYFIITQPSP